MSKLDTTDDGGAYIISAAEGCGVTLICSEELTRSVAIDEARKQVQQYTDHGQAVETLETVCHETVPSKPGWVCVGKVSLPAAASMWMPKGADFLVLKKEVKDAPLDKFTK